MPDTHVDNGGWIHVGPARSRRNRPSSAPTGQNPPAKDMTTSRIQADFAIKSSTWRNSTCRTQTLRLLDRGRPDTGWPCNTCICLAVGSFSRENLESRRRSMLQFAVFMDLVHALQLDTPPKMYAQDPTFTELDREFLAQLGVEVLDVALGTRTLGPAGDLLGLATFLYEPFMEIDGVVQRQIAAAGLGLYVGSSMEAWAALAKSNDGPGGESVQALAREFSRRFQKYRLPRFEEDPLVLDGLSVYYKVADDLSVED